MTIGSLFSGIGGFELGLERAGLGPVLWQAECDPACLAVLARHWPTVKRFHRVEHVTHGAARPKIVCGGFPCQDLSSANVRGRHGLSGVKSGLWREYARVIGCVRPEWVIVENVGVGHDAWVPDVRADLAGLGYASVPMALSPCEVGAPHHRDRIFVVANAHSESKPLRAVHAALACLREVAGRSGAGFGASIAAALARDDGLPARLARLPGNAVVPQVAEAIGIGIVEVSR